MPKRETKYSAEWEKTRSWLKRGDTPYSARCSLCNKQFSISGGGARHIVSHEILQSHRKATPKHRAYCQYCLQGISHIPMEALKF